MGTPASRRDGDVEAAALLLDERGVLLFASAGATTLLAAAGAAFLGERLAPEARRLTRARGAGAAKIEQRIANRLVLVAEIEVVQGACRDRTIVHVLLRTRVPPPPARVKAEAVGRLNEREIEVVELAARGFTNVEIASEVKRSTSTVKARLKKASEKTGASGRAELAALLSFEPLARIDEAVAKLRRETGITEAQAKAARLAVVGLSNHQIARRLRISVATVGCHLTQVYRKVGLAGRRRLAAFVLAKVRHAPRAA